MIFVILERVEMERRIAGRVALVGLFLGLMGVGGFSEAKGAGGSMPGCWAAIAPAVLGQRAVGAPIPAWNAQKEAEEKDEEKKENQDLERGMDVFMPPPREVLKNLFAAQRLLEQGRVSEAVGFLQAILTNPEDYFFQPDPSAPTRRSLKTEAQRLLGRMPQEARQIYELRYGPQARQLLRQAVAEGDPEKLSEISRSFYHTQAGYEATLLLGLHHLRSGRVLAGALILSRLQEDCPYSERWEPTLSLALATAWYRAKMPQQAQATLVRLRAAQGVKPLQVGGRQIAWFQREQDALGWLGQWVSSPGVGPTSREHTDYLMVRNSPSRNASSSGGRPLLNLRWRVPVADHPMLEQWIQRFQQDFNEQGIPCLSQGIPLVVGNTVLMRSLENLVAVDVQTGKRLWESPVGAPLDTILAGQDPQINLGGATLLQMRMTQRLWLDATYSRLSSDGKMVFCIEEEDSGWEHPLAPGMPPIVILRQRMKESRSSSAGNRLVAYDIRTGKLQWELGGLEQQEYALPLAGTTFLGPPLPLMGQLYVLGETRNDIRLLVLEAQTGRLIWSQQLGVVSQEGGPKFDFDAQMMSSGFLGLSPSYAEGILVCPTGRGALVALDLANRTFLWAYAHLPQAEAEHRRMRVLQRLMAFGNPMVSGAVDGWIESSCLLADGRVVFVSPDSPELYCLNLADGKELWKQSCPDGLYVACVHDGKVVWVGRRRVVGVRLADGQPAWSASIGKPMASMVQSAVLGTKGGLEAEKPSSGDGPEGSGRLAIDLPDGAIPTGFGFLSGDKYYLPLSTGEVATVDLTKGEIVHRTRSRTGSVPGNLICVRDKVISQGPGGVELYEQLEPLRAKTQAQLTQNPQDPEALAVWGEILWDEGRRAEAIKAFQQSLTVRADSRIQQFLRETLFEGLEEDFGSYRSYLPELEKLLESPEDRNRYERLLAEGLLQVAEYAAAWQTAFRLAERKDQLGRLEPISKFYTVRGDRWLEDHLNRLQQKAPTALRQQMDRQIQEQLENALQGLDPVGQLNTFLTLYHKHPLADRARQELLSRLVSGGRWLEAELLLRQQAQSAQPEKQRTAVAQLAELLRRAGRPSEAAVYYQQLANQWPNEICLEGKTGRQIVDSLPPEDPVRHYLGPIRWPQGRVRIQIASSTGTSSAADSQFQPVPFHGRLFLSTENITDPLYQDIQIAFDQNRRMLLGFDRFGRELWKPFPLSFGNNPNRFFGFNRSWWKVYLQGHLMVLSTGVHLVAYDLLGVSGGEGPRLLWTIELLDAGRLSNEKEEVLLLGGFPPLPWQQFPGQPGSATIGLVTDRIVCFQQRRYLTGVDTLTGKVLWQRSDLPVGCAIFGDEQQLFVLPPDKAELIVLQTSNGQVIDQRPLPALDFGRTALLTELPAGQVPPPGIIPIHQAVDVNQRGMMNLVLRQYCLTSIGPRLLLWYGQNNKQVLRLYDLREQKDVWGPMQFDINTRLSLLEKEAVGLLEPSGQFSLVRIADGQVLIKDKLDLRQFTNTLQGVHLMHLGDLYLVIPHGAPPGFQQMPLQPVPGMYTAHVPFGQVYAYSTEGKRLWNEPVELRQQNVLLSQPAAVPIVVFATQLFERRGQGGSFNVHLLAIHKQTGRKLLEEKFPYTTNIFQILGAPEKHTVDILLQRNKITFTFTDEAWPADETATSELPSAEEKPNPKKPVTLREGLWRGVQRLLGRKVLPGQQDQPDPNMPRFVPIPLPVPVEEAQEIPK
ncbi:MAG: PQQ-binding-like beta-propeller repeat protein [Thermoguttaceae bacterium]|nr:PQQ-binding-like beta-propeller repeat protein [Thermoguttaceae bacterium]MDW8037763.1 PQQ-binding-like beta-propeller repeat protein [Thermoguttaceae bacterium]